MLALVAPVKKDPYTSYSTMCSRCLLTFPPPPRYKVAYLFWSPYLLTTTHKRIYGVEFCYFHSIFTRWYYCFKQNLGNKGKYTDNWPFLYNSRHPTPTVVGYISHLIKGMLQENEKQTQTFLYKDFAQDLL